MYNQECNFEDPTKVYRKVSYVISYSLFSSCVFIGLTYSEDGNADDEGDENF